MQLTIQVVVQFKLHFLKSSSDANWERFGWTVDMKGHILAIGMPFSNPNMNISIASNLSGSEQSWPITNLENREYYVRQYYGTGTVYLLARTCTISVDFIVSLTLGDVCKGEQIVVKGDVNLTNQTLDLTTINSTTNVIIIDGNLNMGENSTLIINDGQTIQVLGCVNLNGTLIINVNKSKISSSNNETNIPILTFNKNCTSSGNNFDQITVIGTGEDLNDCEEIASQRHSSDHGFSVLLSIQTSGCDVNIQTNDPGSATLSKETIGIIVGCIGFVVVVVLFIVVVVGVILAIKKKKKLKSMLRKVDTEQAAIV